MKKLIIFCSLILLLSACGQKADPTVPPSGKADEVPSSSVSGTEAPSPSGTEAPSPSVPETETPDCAEPNPSAGAAAGEALDAEAFFRTLLEEHPGASAEELADAMLENEYFLRCRKTQAMDYYPGLDYQYPQRPEGIKDAWCVLTYTDANVFYVIETESGTDGEKLAAELKKHVKPQWQWSAEVPADKTAFLARDGKLLFVMYGSDIYPVKGPIARKAQDLVAIFKDYRTENPQATALETVGYLMDHQLDALYTQEVREGELYGFGRKMTETGIGPAAEIKGFADGALLAPQISPSLFLSYVFILPDGADMAAFETLLKENANLGWNVCMIGSTIIIEAEGNAVLFIMC